MDTAIQERANGAADGKRDPRAEGLDEGHEEQYAYAAGATGQAAVSRAAELGSHEYYVDVYPNMDWTPQDEMAT